MTLQRIVLGVLYAIHVIHEYAPEILACWGAITWTLSMLVKRLDMNPRIHAFFQTLIALGINGPAALAWFKEWLQKPMPPTLPRLPDDPASTPSIPPPREPPAVAYMRRPRATCLLDRVGVAFGGLALVLAGCGGASWFTPDHVRDVTDTTATGLCILVHINEPPAQIVRDCKDATAQMVEDYLAARRLADTERTRMLVDANMDTMCGGRK